jgi:hypothetical protein
VVAPPPHKKPSQSQKRGAYLPVLTAGDLGPLFFKSAIGVLGRKPVAWLSGGGLPLFFFGCWHRQNRYGAQLAFCPEQAHFATGPLCHCTTETRVVDYPHPRRAP